MMTYAFNWVKTGASVGVGYDKVQPDNVDIVPYFGAAMRALVAEDDIRMDVADTLRQQLAGNRYRRSSRQARKELICRRSSVFLSVG
jgi:hypothetical protein